MTNLSNKKKIDMLEPNPEDFGLKDQTKYVLPKEESLRSMKSDFNLKISKSEILLEKLKDQKLHFFFWLIGSFFGLVMFLFTSFLGALFSIAPVWVLLSVLGLKEQSYLIISFSILVIVIFVYQLRKSNFKYESVEDGLNFHLKDIDGDGFDEKLIKLKKTLNQVERLISYSEALKKYERQKAETGEDWWKALSSYNLEEAVAGLFNRKGYKASVTKKSGDGGIDVIVRTTEKTLLIQCKGWESKVGVKPIREMAGVVVHSNEINPTGVILSTNGFTVEAIKFAKQSQMLLWDSKTLSEIAKDQYEV